VARFVLVCMGGALGSGARYAVATWALRAFGPDFPRGTLIVNVTGSFLIAVVMAVSLATDAIPADLRVFLTSGVLGGFTTYSSFNYETLMLVQQGRPGLAVLNVAVTLLACLAAGVAGLVLVQRFA
jgi:fluoride exporter